MSASSSEPSLSVHALQSVARSPSAGGAGAGTGGNGTVQRWSAGMGSRRSAAAKPDTRARSAASARRATGGRDGPQRICSQRAGPVSERGSLPWAAATARTTAARSADGYAGLALWALWLHDESSIELQCGRSSGEMRKLLQLRATSAQKQSGVWVHIAPVSSWNASISGICARNARSDCSGA